MSLVFKSSFSVIFLSLPALGLKNTKYKDLEKNQELVNKIQDFNRGNNTNTQPNINPDSQANSPFENFDLSNIMENTNFDFYNYAGLSVMLNSLWLITIFTILVFNNFIVKRLDSNKINNPLGSKVVKIYSGPRRRHHPPFGWGVTPAAGTFINVENYTLIGLAIIPLASQLYVGYLVFTH